jgi:hypothetical protein
MAQVSSVFLMLHQNGSVATSSESLRIVLVTGGK